MSKRDTRVFRRVFGTVVLNKDPFFDAKCAWYRTLKYFFRVKDERRLLLFAVENDPAKLSYNVSSSTFNAPADPLLILMEARLWNNTQLHALQNKFSGMK